VAFDLLIFTADQIARHESGHDMIAKGENVIVFAKGTIESPIITRIAKICTTNYIDIDENRDELYETEMRGISIASGDVFRFYYQADFVGEFEHIGVGKTTLGYKTDSTLNETEVRSRLIQLLNSTQTTRKTK